MEQAKIIIALVIAVIFQWVARSIAEPLAYIDFPLIIVIYVALQGNTIRALFFATLSGIAVDALSGGLLGANGFSKTLVVYLVSEVVRRVYVENLILRLLLLAASTLISGLVYYGTHRLLGQNINGDVFSIVSYTLIATVLSGLVVFLILDNLTAESLKEFRRRSEMFASKRQLRRRGPIRLGRKI